MILYHCPMCSADKPLDQFYFSKKGIVFVHCIECVRKKNQRYYHTKGGFLRSSYKAAKRRILVQPAYINRKVLFTLNEFIDFALNDDKFNKLWEGYVNSNYSRSCAPTLDRIDNDGNYSLDNIQFLTLEDNCIKDYHKSKHRNTTKIYCVELDKYYSGLTVASNELNIPLSTIYNACKKNTSTRGYHFKIIQ
ncbi:MAG: hypothetical protein ACYDA4_14415 [Ignavibacteriaceae bacterium]